MYNTHYGKTLLGCKTDLYIEHPYQILSSCFIFILPIKMHLKKKVHFCLDQIVGSKQAVFGNPWTCCKENNIQVSAWQVVEGTRGLGKKQKAA